MGRKQPTERHPGPPARTLVVLAAVLLTAATSGFGWTPGSHVSDTPAVCDGFAFPGDDLTAVVAATGRSQTLCLTSGTYVVGELRLDRSIELRSAPGGKATLLGRLNVAAGADGSVIRGLTLDGSGPQSYATSVAVAADGVTFRDNDVSNDHTAICFAIGNPQFGRADQTRIVGNTIHDCGAEPRTNFEHGIYVAYARGTTIAHNRIVGNADRGVQLYPDVSGTTIAANVISGNGQGVAFGGKGERVARHSRVVHNLITDSQAGQNVGSAFRPGGAIGFDNVVRANCIGAQSGFGRRTVGFSESGNVIIATGSDPPAAELPRACRAAAGAGAAGSG